MGWAEPTKPAEPDHTDCEIIRSELKTYGRIIKECVAEAAHIVTMLEAKKDTNGSLDEFDLNVVRACQRLFEAAGRES